MSGLVFEENDQQMNMVGVVIRLKHTVSPTLVSPRYTNETKRDGNRLKVVVPAENAIYVYEKYLV